MNAKRSGQELASLSREELEIRLRQCENDLRLTQEESRENSLKYMEMVSELGESNLELQSLKDGLEDVLKARNAELLLAREGQGDFARGFSGPELKSVLELALEEPRRLAAARGCSVSLSCPDGISLVSAGVLGETARRVSEALMPCCGKGSSLEALAESREDGLAISFMVSGEGVDRLLLAEILKPLEPSKGGEWLPSLLSSLAGWRISAREDGLGAELKALSRK